MNEGITIERASATETDRFGGSVVSASTGAVGSSAARRLWTPDRGPSGLIVVPRSRPLAAVIGGRLFAVGPPGGDEAGDAVGFGERLRQVTLGGLVIVSNSRQKEPTRVVGHPDLASGASVQRGDVLYVSVAEAIYRESRGEEVQVHLTPTPEDNEALADLRTRARHRWENDRLPDGWTRPLPPPADTTPTPSKERSLAGALPDELRALVERIRAKEASEEEDGERP